MSIRTRGLAVVGIGFAWLLGPIACNEGGREAGDGSDIAAVDVVPTAAGEDTSGSEVTTADPVADTASEAFDAIEADVVNTATIEADTVSAETTATDTVSTETTATDTVSAETTATDTVSAETTATDTFTSSECAFVATSEPDLWAQVCPDKAHFALGETVTFTFEIENRGASSKTVVVTPNCGGHLYAIDIRRADGSVLRNSRYQCGFDGESFPPPDNFDPVDVVIAAGDRWSTSITWDQRQFFGPGPYNTPPGPQVVPGIYTVSTSLRTNPGQVLAASASFAIDDATPPAVCAASEGDAVAFQAPDQCLGGDLPWDVIAVDVNHDQILDMVVAEFAGHIGVFLGKGGGSFGQALEIPTANGPYQVATGDFDGDHNPDLVVGYEDQANQARTDISVFFGHGDGTFGAATSLETSGRWPRGVSVADIDGDTDDDIVAVAALDSVVAVFINDGTGHFAAAKMRAMTSSAAQVQAGHIDDDATVDLIVTVQNGGALLLRGLGDGTFADPVELFPGLNGGSLALSDLNCDGALDVVLADLRGEFVVLLGDGTGAFESVGAYDSPGWLDDIAIADFNGDHILDVASAHYTDDDLAHGISIFAGHGDGTFGGPTFFAASRNPQGLDAADLDGDGKADLMVAARHGFVSVLLTGPDLGGPPADCGVRGPGGIHPIIVRATGQYDPSGLAVTADSVYWTNFDAGSLSPDGGQVWRLRKSDGTTTQLARHQFGPAALAVDATHVYWSNYRGGTSAFGNTLGHAIMRAPIDGSAEPEVVANDPLSASTIVLDADKVYFRFGGGVGVVPKVGGAVSTLCCSGTWAFAKDATQIFGFATGAIVAYSLADATTTTFASGQSWPTGMAVDSAGVYWTQYNGAQNAGLVVGRAFADGAEVKILASGQRSPAGIVSDGIDLYWVSSSPSLGAIMRMPISGGTPETIAWEQQSPTSLIVDAQQVHWVNRGSGEILSMAK